MEINAPYLVIVEDNPDDSFWLKRELTKTHLGLPVKLLADGTEAMDFFTSLDLPPVALFLDLHLPGTPGLQLLHVIKETPKLAKILIFILDGSSSPKELDECAELGVTGVLDKPVTLEALQSMAAPLIQNAV